MAQRETAVLTFGETTLYQSNIQTLAPKTWLDDQIINFYFDYLELTKYKDAKDKLAFCGATVVYGWRSSPMDSDTLGMIYWDPLKLREKELIFMIINDNENAQLAFGGSHWSLLVFRRSTKRFEHYDSYVHANWAPACKTAKVIARYLGADAEPIKKACPAQKNAADCGVYAISFAEFLADQHLGKIAADAQMSNHLTPEAAVEKRKQVKQLIYTLAAQKMSNSPENIESNPME